ncbi:MAG: hypothetical protein KIB00_17490 [Paeniclostridium sordellii]|nr:hypothetical protein [Paeniclostridium sordellii]
MNQDQLNEIFKEVSDHLIKTKYSKEEMLKRMKIFSTENNTIDNVSLAQFFFFENMKFTQIYLNEVLTKVLLHK